MLKVHICINNVYDDQKCYQNWKLICRIKMRHRYVASIIELGKSEQPFSERML